MLRAAASGLLLLFAASIGSARGAADAPVIVVELFTSQGCSSCPPADAVLGELARREDVLALSEHVDYWDYLGWKDPFSNADVTQRQREYARTLGLGYVYTPQLVIHGTRQVVGSDRAQVMEEIANMRAAKGVSIALRADGAAGAMISLAEQGIGEDADLWLVVFDKQHTTRILRGENRGRELRHYNVVRHLARVGTWEGKAVSLAVALPEVVPLDACAVLVQGKRSGKILGAARLDFAKTPAK
jgi:hypothetical protein